jgi:hypothetical protein
MEPGDRLNFILDSAVDRCFVCINVQLLYNREKYKAVSHNICVLM